MCAECYRELARDASELARERSQQREQITEAAAFLDVLAHHMTRWPAIGNHLKEQQQAAADCRAMAAKLRGEREYDPDVAPCDDAEFGMKP
jgi:hypothetical protein